MIVLDLSILNQKGTPMFNSDILANQPAAGIVGRIFIATNSPYGIFRDNGTTYDQIASVSGGSTNIYNTDGTLTANRVVSDGGFGLSFIPTTHIGTAAIGGGGSGKLIVGSSTSDNGIQIFGANSPSLRIDNAQSGGTQRFVFGLATATNNFIQGATAGQFCITTASSGAMLFGMWQTVNATEAFRVSTANNIIVGSSFDNGNRFQVSGASTFSGNVIVGGEFKVTGAYAGSQGSIAITGGSGLFIQGKTGSSFDLTLAPASGVAALQIASTGAITTGKLIVSGEFQVTGLYQASQGSIGITGGSGLFITGKTGTNFDIAIATASGTAAISIASTAAVTFSSSIAINNSVAASVAAPSTHKVAILIGGVQYYLLASNI